MYCDERELQHRTAIVCTTMYSVTRKKISKNLKKNTENTIFPAKNLIIEKINKPQLSISHQCTENHNISEEIITKFSCVEHNVSVTAQVPYETN